MKALVFNLVAFVYLMAEKGNEAIVKAFEDQGFGGDHDNMETLKVLANHNHVNGKAVKALRKLYEEFLTGDNADPKLIETYNKLVSGISLIPPVYGKRFYFLNVAERNGEYEYNHKSVMELPHDTDPIKYFHDTYPKDFYGGSVFEENDGFYFNGGEVCVCTEPFKEITKEEYEVLKKYI